MRKLTATICLMIAVLLGSVVLGNETHHKILGYSFDTEYFPRSNGTEA
jgi:hypothetical protein